MKVETVQKTVGSFEDRTLELRFLRGRLQQKWRLYTEVGVPLECYSEEWRDVPDATPPDVTS